MNSNETCSSVKHQRFIFQHTIKIQNVGWAEIHIRYGGTTVSCLSVAWTAASIVFADGIPKFVYRWDKCLHEFG